MINLKFSNTEEPFYDVELDEYGNICFYNKEGRLHRLDGPAKIYPDGGEEYWVNGRLHRIDGPALNYSSGYKGYFINDSPHRLDGPAIIWPSGYKEYWINGKRLTKKEFNNLTKIKH